MAMSAPVDRSGAVDRRLGTADAERRAQYVPWLATLARTAITVKGLESL